MNCFDFEATKYIGIPQTVKKTVIVHLTLAPEIKILRKD